MLLTWQRHSIRMMKGGMHLNTVFEEMKGVHTNSKLEIICCLLAHQDEPVRLDEIVESTGLPLEKVERELDELEGPFGSAETGGGYIHRARCSSQAVFIA